VKENAFVKPEYAVIWLRERARINRDNATIPPEQWEARVLPYIADRLDAAADEIERLHEANVALTTSLFAAWDALNEIHHDAAEMEADAFKALETYGNRPIDAVRWPCDHEAHKS
jgi:hypothetical protein